MDIKFSLVKHNSRSYRVEALSSEGSAWLNDRANGVDLEDLSGPQARELEAQAILDMILTEGEV